MLTVFECVWYRQPWVVVRLLEIGLLHPDWPVPGVFPVPASTPPETATHVLMAHDAYRRVRGAIRQVRWAG